MDASIDALCRVSLSAQSVSSERASMMSARDSFTPSSVRSTRQSYLPQKSKSGALPVPNCKHFEHDFVSGDSILQ